ncbi:MAG: ornithine cyclodeaminase family protein [Bacillati bacterium ANGP1]|uniref:Ornithine cyclodeaminase family protein n=1 Tax=Candidatus Segetimicrobium genomatis TaxID=2569760 RepID=A0A537K3W6_9BACT|nr:MAG: ornithine cyclodeaminase family protein [Terrabacteria group bacterium ANGP1]
MTAGTAPLWIAEADVASLLDLGEAIAALEQGLRLEARGEARNMTKTHVTWQGGTLHAIGASFESTGIVGTKTWANTPRGATPLLVLFDAGTGALVAVIEAFALGQLRTSSISGIATGRLARRDARTFAIIGTGEQALPQVAAVAAVRPLASVRVFGRNPERRAAFARRVEEGLGLSAVAQGSVAEAVEGADIVTLVTRATEPFLRSAMLARGAHVNAVGAITPERAEFEPDILDRCNPIAVDSLPQVQRLSREFSAYFEAGGRDWSRVTLLSALVDRPQARPEESDLTLFKAMGMGISDLALGVHCYRKAMEGGLGRTVQLPKRVEIRLKPQKCISGGVRHE